MHAALRLNVTRLDFPLLFRTDKSSLGVSRIGVATPWDDCPYAKSNANTFVRARAYRVFLTLCTEGQSGFKRATASESLRTRSACQDGQINKQFPGILYKTTLTLCVWMDLGDVPSVGPSTLGGKPYTNSPPSSIVTILLKLNAV